MEELERRARQLFPVTYALRDGRLTEFMRREAERNFSLQTADLAEGGTTYENMSLVERAQKAEFETSVTYMSRYSRERELLGFLETLADADVDHYDVLSRIAGFSRRPLTEIAEAMTK